MDVRRPARAVCLSIVALLVVAGCGPPEDTIDTRRWPWSDVNNPEEVERFLREHPEYAPDR